MSESSWHWNISTLRHQRIRKFRGKTLTLQFKGRYILHNMRVQGEIPWWWESRQTLCFAGSRMRNLSSAGTFFGDRSRYWNWVFSHQVVITGACNNRSSKLPLKVLWKKFFLSPNLWNLEETLNLQFLQCSARNSYTMNSKCEFMLVSLIERYAVKNFQV